MSSPQTQHQGLIRSTASIDSHTACSPTNNNNHHSPQPDLAQMTNVNVLDLHKEYVPEKTQHGSIQYIYGGGDAKGQNVKIDGNEMGNGSILQRAPPASHHQVLDEPPRQSPIVVNNSVVTHANNANNNVDQLFEKMGLSDEQILRLIAPNGENQQIISREIINGEPHILTRTENGEHVLTRIVTAADPKLTANDGGVIYSTNDQAVVSDAPPTDAVSAADQIYTAPPNHITTSVLQYGDTGPIKNGLHVPSYVPTVTTGSSVITSVSSTGAIIKEEDIYPGDKVPIYTSTANELMYEDGKTVIYTTTSDPSELNLINGDGQVIVQGSVQYTTANGQTVFVVTDPPMDADINARYVQNLLLSLFILFAFLWYHINGRVSN